MNNPSLVQFPYDSNMRYLPLVYFLPGDLFSQCFTLRRLLQDLAALAASEVLISLFDSDQFLNEIIDAAASLAFPHFGFGG